MSNEKSKLDLKTLVMVIATVVIALASVGNYLVSLNYYNALELTLVPNKVDPKIFLKEEKLTLSPHRLADPLSPERIEVCVTNYGRIASGRITLFWDNDWTTSRRETIEDILGGETVCEYTFLSCRECVMSYNEDNDELNYSFLPSEEEIQLILEMGCENCEFSSIRKKFDAYIW